MQVRNLIRCAIAAAAWCVLQSVSMSVYADGGYHRAVDKALTDLKAAGHSRPIVETHIHFWQFSGPGAPAIPPPWPTPAEGPIYRNVLPADYTAMAKTNGIVTAGIVEASGIVEHNQWVLDLVKGDGFYSFYVGNLEIGAPTFAHDLERFSKDHRWVGIRGYLTGPPEGITLSLEQLASLHDLARRGMTLDIISRGTKNPKDQVLALCTAVPDLRIIIDHLGGAKGPPPVDPTWELEIRRLADVCPNLYMKFSSFYDMYAPGDVVSASPRDLGAYKTHFDVLMTAFGPDRLIWGSNWPVIELHGPDPYNLSGGFWDAGFADQIRLAEEYLAPFGQVVRDKVMFRNALLFYRRHVPNENDDD